MLVGEFCVLGYALLCVRETMKTDVKLGSIIDKEESWQRDAIHIAVTPAIASEKLSPGQHVGLIGADTVRVGSTSQSLIGIVDPFLAGPVSEGEMFWMLLYQNTVTSLRHEWTHPAFAVSDKATAHAWIESFAVELGVTYKQLMAGAERWREDGDYTDDNSEKYKDIDYSKWATFWGYYQALTGWIIPVEEQEGFFTCSCQQSVPTRR